MPRPNGIAGRHWGAYVTTSDLPNVSGALVQSADLSLGDLAAAAGELYLCTACLESAATWVKVASSGETITTLITTGSITPGGGIVGSTPIEVPNIPLGSVAYGSLGTDTTPVAGTIYVAEFFLAANKTITGLKYLTGTGVGTDKVIVALYSAAGVKLANSATAGTTITGTDAFKTVAFTAAYDAIGPAKYLVAIQIDGTAGKFRSIAASTFRVATISQAGVFGTLAALSPVPTVTVANVGPIVVAYT
jgi:hypothetical protein